MEKAYLITQNTDLSKNFKEFDRLYIWDQYCEHNMFYFFDNKLFIDKIINLKKKITITTPIISEKWINNFIKFLDLFISKSEKNIVDLEIVVNEQWLYFIINKKYPDIKIIWGNFLSGQNKDPYLKIFKDKDDHKLLSIDSLFYKKLFIKSNINRIELYNVFQWIKINQKFEINLYFPYVVYSINRYCVNALINQNKNYLEIVENCEWCKNIENKDLNMEIKIWEKNEVQFFRWNKQFYINEKISNNENIKRIIYNTDLI